MIQFPFAVVLSMVYGIATHDDGNISTTSLSRGYDIQEGLGKDALNTSCSEDIYLLSRVWNSISLSISRIITNLVTFLQWISPFSHTSPTLEAPSGIIFKTYWPKIAENKEGQFEEYNLLNSKKEHLPIQPFPLPNEPLKKCAIPPYNMGIHIHFEEGSKMQKMDIQKLAKSALVRSASATILSFLNSRRVDSSALTDLFVNLSKRIKITGARSNNFYENEPSNAEAVNMRSHDANHILSPRLKEIGSSSQNSINLVYSLEQVVKETFRNLENSLNQREIQSLQDVKDRIHFDEVNAEAPRTVAHLDNRCGLLYDSFNEVSSRYSTFVASNNKEHTFLAFFSDEEPPVELQKVVPTNLWDDFRKDAVLCLKRSLGNFVPCRAHSSFSPAHSQFTGLCTSVKSMNVNNTTLSPLEQKGYPYTPVLEHMRDLWPGISNSNGFDLEGICFVATDRLIFENLYDANKELVLHSSWEKAAMKHTRGKLTTHGRELIRRLSHAKLFCPCRSSALNNRVTLGINDEDREVLVQIYDGS